jgi:tRNA A22 N-methylase
VQASELAKMLEGWPEEARGEYSVWFSQNCEQIEQMEGGELRIPVRLAIDLACMSGLRHLCIVALIDIDSDRMTGRHRIILRPRMAATILREYSGPTLLHAIDAAIRAVARA